MKPARPRRRLLPLLAVAAAAYLLSPVDLVPDVLPLIGFGDDALVVLGVLAHALSRYLSPPSGPGDDGPRSGRPGPRRARERVIDAEVVGRPAR